MADFGIGEYLALAATAVSAYGSYNAGQSQEKVADYNASIAANKAQAALQQGTANAQAIAVKRRRMLGAQAAASGASGLAGGSSLDLFAESAFNAELDQQQAILNSSTTAAGLEADSQGFTLRGETAAQNGDFSAAATLLGGAAKQYGAGGGTGSSIPISATGALRAGQNYSSGTD